MQVISSWFGHRDGVDNMWGNPMSYPSRVCCLHIERCLCAAGENVVILSPSFDPSPIQCFDIHDKKGRYKFDDELWPNHWQICILEVVDIHGTKLSLEFVWLALHYHKARWNMHKQTHTSTHTKYRGDPRHTRCFMSFFVLPFYLDRSTDRIVWLSSQERARK